VDEAIVKIESILAEHPNDGISITYLGRIYKEMWVSSWNYIRDKEKRLKKAFDSYHWLIKSADIYLKGFRLDLNDEYPAINAFTLSLIAVYLADKFDSKKSPDPDITRLRDGLAELSSTLRFVLDSRVNIDEENANYWTLVSLAELTVMTTEHISDVVRAYRKAITASRRNLFSLNSSLAQLEMLKSLGMRAKFVKAAVNLVEEEVTRVSDGEAHSQHYYHHHHNKSKLKLYSGRSFLFSGYMIDHSRKDKKNFPPEKEAEIRNDIRKLLSKYKPNSNDRAYLSGLSGGSEIIFAEVCIEMGLEVKAYLPLSDSNYIREFVSPAGEDWVDRFYKIRNNPLVDSIHQIDNLGQPKDDDNPYERNNRWALYSALGRAGIQNVRLIAVWNETGGEPRDRDARLVRHMIELTRDMGGQIETINPSKFIYNVIDTALKRLIIDAPPDKEKPVTNMIKRSKPNKK